MPFSGCIGDLMSVMYTNLSEREHMLPQVTRDQNLGWVFTLMNILLLNPDGGSWHSKELTSGHFWWWHLVTAAPALNAPHPPQLMNVAACLSPKAPAAACSASTPVP